MIRKLWLTLGTALGMAVSIVGLHWSTAQEPPKTTYPISRPSPSRVPSLPQNPKDSHPSRETSFSKGEWLTLERCPVFALESVEIASVEAGMLASLDVDENQSVAADQIIAKLDSKVAEIEKTAAGLQLQMANSEAQDESEIRLAEALVEETQLQADIYEEMLNKGTTSPTDFRQRQLAVQQAKVRLTQSRTIKQQRETKAKLSQSALTLAQQKLERLSLRTPIAGTITRVDHRAGEFITAGSTVVKVTRMDELRVDCFVDINEIDPASLIHQSVKVIAKRGTSELLFAGRVASYDPDVTSSGKVRVHVVVQNQKSGEHWLLLPGMTANMQLIKPQ